MAMDRRTVGLLIALLLGLGVGLGVGILVSHVTPGKLRMRFFNTSPAPHPVEWKARLGTEEDSGKIDIAEHKMKDLKTNLRDIDEFSYRVDLAGAWTVVTVPGGAPANSKMGELLVDIFGANGTSRYVATYGPDDKPTLTITSVPPQTRLHLSNSGGDVQVQVVSRRNNVDVNDTMPLTLHQNDHVQIAFAGEVDQFVITVGGTQIPVNQVGNNLFGELFLGIESATQLGYTVTYGINGVFDHSQTDITCP